MAKATLPHRCVYAIVCTDGRAYVGSTKHCRKRWSAHRFEVRRGTHGNKPLQRAWTEMGEAAFEFTVLEVIAPDADLLAAEQRWMDKMRSECELFNVFPSAGSPRGVKFSEDACAKNAAARITYYESQAAREKTALAMVGVAAGEKHGNARLTDATVIEIRRLSDSGSLQREIAATFGIGRSTVANIVRRSVWTHLA